MENQSNASPDTPVPVPPPAPSVPPPRPPAPPMHYPPQKIPGLAGALSLFPGLGNIYNGLYLRGVSMFVVIMSLIGIAGAYARDVPEIPIMVFTIIFVWLFNMFDAYRQATLINLGRRGLAFEDDTPGSGLGAGELLPGALLILIGLYGVLQVYFHFDLDIIWENWPIPVLAFGGFLIWQGMRRRRSLAAQDEPAEESV